MLVRLDLRPDRRQLRQFGFIALVAFLALGFAAYSRGELFGIRAGEAAAPMAYLLWALGILSAAFALVWPEGNRPLYVTLTLATFPIGWLISHLVLALLFYAVLTPVGLLFRLLKRDALARDFEPERETYWVDLPQVTDKRDYFRQF